MENSYLKWLAGQAGSVVWHDSASMQELGTALEYGAVGATTNPYLVNRARSGDGAGGGACPPSAVDGLGGDSLAEARSLSAAAALLVRLQACCNARYGGYCCAQLDPYLAAREDAMLAQAERYSRISPRIVVKVPASRAGIAVLEECAARGYNVAATVSFSVAQALAAGEAFQRGSNRAREKGISPGLGIAVVMVGRLDDYLREVCRDTGIGLAEEDVIQSGIAVIKRAYALFEERGYNCVLMPAAARGTYHLAALAGANMIFSVAPGIARQAAELRPPYCAGIGQPVPAPVIRRLMVLAEFRKAYEPAGMVMEEFITFGPFNRTLTQFQCSGWDRLNAT